MYELTPYPAAKQATDNSCWASAARSIANWYASLDTSGNTPAFSSDQALADAWNARVPGQNHNDIDIQQSAAGALADLGFTNSMDQQPLPTTAEIVESIDMDMPLLAIVGPTAPPGGMPNPAATGGHWVVITGISGDAPDAMLQVFDPADGQIHPVQYDPSICAFQGESPLFWQNTSYVDPYQAPVAESAGDVQADAPTNVVSLQSGAARRAAPPAPSAGSWNGTARGAVALTIQWVPFAGGEGVDLTINQTDGPGAPLTRTATLGGGATNAQRNCRLKFGDTSGPIELNVILAQDQSQQMKLLVDYPLSQGAAVHNRIIAHWLVESASA